MKKLSDVVDNEVVKNTKFNTLKTKDSTTDTTTSIHRNQYNTDKYNLEKKIVDVNKIIPDTIGLVTTPALNTKISEVENKIPDTSSLGTSTVLKTKIRKVENKIPDHTKYITTPEFHKLTAENFATRLKQANLVSKTDFDIKLINFNRKITLNKTKYLEFQKKLNNLTTNIIIFSYVEFILQVMMVLRTRWFINQDLIH